jgi:hypothetical protein
VQVPTTDSPEHWALDQNYPNPFNPTTSIRYQLPHTAEIRIVVYDMLGREVAVLLNEERKPGTYTVTWDATGKASGIYLCRMQSGEFVQVRKITLPQ